MYKFFKRFCDISISLVALIVLSPVLLLLCILTAIFNIWGYVIALILFVFAIVKNKMVSGQSYLYPLLPFSFKKLGKVLIRTRLPGSRE